MGAIKKAQSKESPLPPRSTVLAVIGLVSAAGLVFEITLTRIFSLYFQYHFTFLAVSLAIFGLSLGAAWEHFTSADDQPPSRTLIILLVSISAALLLVSAGIAWLPIASSILPQTVLALVPFVLIGRLMAFIYARYTAQSGQLYAADLIGAALGVLGALILLGLWSAFSMVIALAVALGVLAAGLTLASVKPFRLAYLVAGAGAVMLILNLVSGLFDFDPARLSDPPRDKTMLTVLSDPAQKGHILRTAWSPFARVDVVETSDTNARYIFSDGGAGSYMLHYDGTPQSVSYLKDSLEYLPFTAISAQKTLILGAGGGKDIIMARLAGAQQITALEVNPAVVGVTRGMADYNGGVLDLPGVETIVGDARTYAERTDEQFDLIYLNLVYTQSPELASQALVENYIFTREAFRAYWARLKPDGHLAIIAHNALEASRAALTALLAMQDEGIEPNKALDHLVLWMYPADDATLRTGLLIMGKDPLTTDVIKTIQSGAQKQGMQPLFEPGIAETLFEPLRRNNDLEKYIQGDADYNLKPTSDDSPYFFNLDPGLPSPIILALLWATILVIGLLAVTLARRPRVRPPLALVGYAGLIGAGFMLIEIPLMQRFGLLLGQPILSVGAVLGALLIAGGIGSLISQRWPGASLGRRVTIAALAVAVLVVLYRFVLPNIVDPLLGAPLGVRLLIVVLLTALPGLPMGVPFPSLLRLVGEGKGARERVAMLWALNGGFAVLGSTLAMLLSMLWGFSWALLLGALLYVILAGLAWRIKAA